MQREMYIPEIKTNLRSRIIEVPKEIDMCSGTSIFGKKLKSFIFSTDVAIIINSNADAVIAVYPFTPQPIITKALIESSGRPVLSGVGGGLTTGDRVVSLALDAEFKGAIGVVVNSPTSNDVIRKIRSTIDIPIVVTVTSIYDNIEERLKAGATIFNVSGAKDTPAIVRRIREVTRDFPIIATGGPTTESIIQTIESGANAITYTPPTSAEIFKNLMRKYRMINEKEINPWL